MALPRTMEQKLKDASQAYEVFSKTLTPDPMRGLINKLTEVEVNQEDPSFMGAYASLVQSSMSIARVIGANDRAALVAAVMLTSGGISRPINVIDPDEA